VERETLKKHLEEVFKWELTHMQTSCSHLATSHILDLLRI
jgi:hypothetical protein